MISKHTIANNIQIKISINYPYYFKKASLVINPILSRISGLCLLLLLLFLSPIAKAGIQEQRQLYLQARQALKDNKLQSYNVLKPQLVSYPLYPYLIYAELVKQLGNTPELVIQQFLQQYADTPLALKIRNQWLFILAHRKRWQDFIALYQDTNDLEMQCYNRQALLNSYHSMAAFENFDSLWQTGRNLPESCNAVFNQWYLAKAMPVEVIWQRLGLAIQAQNKTLIYTLSAMLPKTNLIFITLWQKLYTDPRLLTQKKYSTAALPHAITLHVLQRLAEIDPQLAIKLWRQKYNYYPFSKLQKNQLFRTLGIALASQGSAEANSWFEKIAPEFKDKVINEWQIRIALSQQNWLRVKMLIEQLSEADQALPESQYWLARSYESQGQTATAKNLYYKLKYQNNYYGFLAKNRLGEIPFFKANQLIIKPAELADLQQLPGIKRAYEFYQLGLLNDARLEWQFALQQLKASQRYVAAQIALEWGWYERAISTAMQNNFSDDLTHRFPLGYRDEVILTAKIYNLDPAWIFAVIRQESGFKADALSRVGALGLMQLMPSTAQLVCRQLKQQLFHPYEALETTLNIRLGTHYLQQLLTAYRGNIILTSAAYNAGPGRVRKWLQLRPRLPGDIWIETIPWKETRNYVKNIIAFKTIYQFHLGETPDLKDLNQLIR